MRQLANELRQAGADAMGGAEAELERVAGQLAKAQASAAQFRNELRQHEAEIGGVGAALGEVKGLVGEVASRRADHRPRKIGSMMDLRIGFLPIAGDVRWRV
jgi:hypothetical protein